MLTITNEDCMDLMARTPDKFYDLSIVDPPYGIGAAKKQYSSIPSEKYKNPKKIIYNKKWDDKTPCRQYFIELMRTSRQQTIACHDYNFDLTACELDKDYFDAAMMRINNHKAQTNLFLTPNV